MTRDVDVSDSSRQQIPKCLAAMIWSRLLLWFDQDHIWPGTQIGILFLTQILQPSIATFALHDFNPLATILNSGC